MMTVYDAYAREAYWLGIKDSPKSNPATKEVARCEAKAWRSVAATLSLLNQATAVNAPMHGQRGRIEIDDSPGDPATWV